MLPFTETEFFAVFGRYNLAIWPAQIVAYALALVAIGALIFRPAWGAHAVFVVLALLWGWTGAAYHLGYFSTINPAAWLFGAAFILQAGLLAHHALKTGPAPERRRLDGVIGWTMIAYAALLYPLLNGWLGHAYPQAPAFGVTPCPLTIFTFGLMSLAHARLPWRLYAIPVVWSAIGGSAALMLGVAADWALPAAGLLALALNTRKPAA